LLAESEISEAGALTEAALSASGLEEEKEASSSFPFTRKPFFLAARSACRLKSRRRSIGILVVGGRVPGSGGNQPEGQMVSKNTVPEGGLKVILLFYDVPLNNSLKWMYSQSLRSKRYCCFFGIVMSRFRIRLIP
jgi:hypothetical protein